jgi:hypothetical protein
MQDKPITEKKSVKTDKKRQFGCGKGIFTFSFKKNALTKPIG